MFKNGYYYSIIIKCLICCMNFPGFMAHSFNFFITNTNNVESSTSFWGKWVPKPLECHFDMRLMPIPGYNTMIEERQKKKKTIANSKINKLNFVMSSCHLLTK